MLNMSTEQKIREWFVEVSSLFEEEYANNEQTSTTLPQQSLDQIPPEGDISSQKTLEIETCVKTPEKLIPVFIVTSVSVLTKDEPLVEPSQILIPPKRSLANIFDDTVPWPTQKPILNKRKREYTPSDITCDRWVE
ncbi:unnamed protein product [Psylliodes chrysocephalus]|uniref:Uncharacterized protein n=1 Tax=Psylliodes chrysocephalus TaxID=3402493 RepID=A0A9P0D5E1_9CUCU|nr:unnamed protein product [Psylliodes chrysocephala]